MSPAIGPGKEYIIHIKTYWDRLGEEADSYPRHALKSRKKFRVFSPKRRPVLNKKCWLEGLCTGSGTSDLNPTRLLSSTVLGQVNSYL